MDGLPALHVAQKTRIQEQIEPLKKMVGPLAPAHYQNGKVFGFEHLVMVALMTAVITVIVLRYGIADTTSFIHAPLRTII